MSEAARLVAKARQCLLSGVVLLMVVFIVQATSDINSWVTAALLTPITIMACVFVYAAGIYTERAGASQLR